MGSTCTSIKTEMSNTFQQPLSDPNRIMIPKSYTATYYSEAYSEK
jgi:hypothetical protein